MTSKLCVLTTLIKKARSSLVSVNSTCAQLPHNFSMYLGLVCEKDRVGAFITYIKLPNWLKGLHEPILFDSVVSVFVLRQSARTSLDANRRSIHIALHLSEICPQATEAQLSSSVAVGMATTTAFSEAFLVLV